MIIRLNYCFQQGVYEPRKKIGNEIIEIFNEIKFTSTCTQIHDKKELILFRLHSIKNAINKVNEQLTKSLHSGDENLSQSSRKLLKILNGVLQLSESVIELSNAYTDLHSTTKFSSLGKDKRERTSKIWVGLNLMCDVALAVLFRCIRQVHIEIPRGSSLVEYTNLLYRETNVCYALVVLFDPAFESSGGNIWNLLLFKIEVIFIEELLCSLEEQDYIENLSPTLHRQLFLK